MVVQVCVGSSCHLKGSPEIVALLQKAVEDHHLENEVTLIKSDLFDNLLKGDKYDVIVANPPYVDEYDLSTMPDEYHCEPDLALGSGADGLDCAKRILADAPE